MTTLKVVVDQLVIDQLAPSTADGVSRYAEDLTRQIILAAPRDCDVEGLMSAVPPPIFDAVAARLPGIGQLTMLPVARREVAIAWQSGISLPGTSGMLHAPSLLAPLTKHDRQEDGDQVTVTIHDMVAFTHPESLDRSAVRWQKAMIRRARKFADAVVVPTHAVADQLAERVDFGDRVRVIAGAASTNLRLPLDADERARQLELPERFILGMGSINPRKGIRSLIQAMALPATDNLPLLIAGPDRYGDESALGVAAAAGLPEGRIRPLGRLDDADLAVLLHRASVFVFPSLAEGFGLPLVEAFQFGTPVVHSDDPALVEVAGGAGITVTRDDPAGYPERLATAIGDILTNAELAARLRVQSTDRARAFSWRDSAERIWQLHADL